MYVYKIIIALAPYNNISTLLKPAHFQPIIVYLVRTPNVKPVHLLHHLAINVLEMMDYETLQITVLVPMIFIMTPSI
jgi:hypothetical protein